MRVLYNILTYIAAFHLKLAALFNKKLKLGIDGRTQTFSILNSIINVSDKVIWFHCASLGEYEQGLPVFEAIKKDFPKHKIVLSFFSPSGYEVRKNAPIAHAIVYLPFDTKANAKRFLNSIHPELVLFIKYEIWPNYINELQKRNINTVLVSALFRKEQLFFKSYGAFMRKALSNFNHIFTQDLNSKNLLNSIGIDHVTVSGDTRFDRVSNQLRIDNTLDFVSDFKQNNLLVVAGSTWPEDDELLVTFLNNHLEDSVKFIIAPHNIKAQQILRLKNAIHKKTVLYSEKNNHSISEYEVLILDTIGILTKVYSYGDIAYIGGAIGTTGLHNTLEAAVFGIPIIIGNNYKKFPEAKAMIDNKGMIAISNQKELNTTMNLFIKNPSSRLEYGKNNANYITKNKGAVVQIVNFLRI